MPEHHAAPVGDAVDGALPAGRQLHDQEIGPTLGWEQLHGLLEPHRDGARPLVEELMGTVDRRVEDPESPRARREHRLEADRPVGVAELVRRARDLARAVDAAIRRSREAETMKERVGLRLVVRAMNRVGAGDEHRDREALAVGGQALQIERRLGEDDVHLLSFDDVEDRIGEGRVCAGRDEMECVAEVTADRALGHVRSDEAHLALAVVPQPAEQGSRPRCACSRDEDGDRSHWSHLLTSRRWVWNHSSRATR